MKRISIPTSKEYGVIIGSGLLENAGALIKDVTKAKKAAIVTDDRVNALYADKLQKSLDESGFDCCRFVFENGEGSKNLTTYAELLEFLAENRLTRDDLIVALGGGVVGDLSGFAAATYLRGVDFVQIPTTLLATVDSSVGGKTAVDLKSGKNLVGAFYQPSLVIADTDTLATLDEKVFSDGMAETIKYGILFDEEFFRFLNENEAKDNLEYIIEKCVCFKRDTVAKDEKDRGIRGLLNLGHTVGHAVEKCSGYTVSHGFAVAAGTVIISSGAYKCGLCDTDISKQLKEVFEKYSLPVTTDFGVNELLEACKNDKKSTSDGITLVLPERIGKCRLYKTDFDVLAKIIEEGIKA